MPRDFANIPVTESRILDHFLKLGRRGTTLRPGYFFLHHVLTVNFLIKASLESQDDSTAIAAILPLESGGLETTKPLKHGFLGVPPRAC